MLDKNFSNIQEGLDPTIQEFMEGLSSIPSQSTEQEENESPVTENHKEKKENVVKSNIKKVSPSLKDLTFIRLLDPIHIPSYLVDQIKDRLFDTEKFYQYQKISCISQTAKGPQLNEDNLLYAVTNEKIRQVKGFLWMVIDRLNESIEIRQFSMDKEYWDHGNSEKCLDLLEEKAKKVMKDLHLRRMVWITRNPRFDRKEGYTRKKTFIVTYES